MVFVGQNNILQTLVQNINTFIKKTLLIAIPSLSICEICTRQQTVTIWNPLFLLKYRSRLAKTNELSWTKFSCQTLLNKYMLFIKIRREYLIGINEMVKVSNILSLQCFFLNSLKIFTWNKLFMGTWFYWKKTGNSACDTVWIA